MEPRHWVMHQLNPLIKYLLRLHSFKIMFCLFKFMYELTVYKLCNSRAEFFQNVQKRDEIGMRMSLTPYLWFCWTFFLDIVCGYLRESLHKTTYFQGFATLLNFIYLMYINLLLVSCLHILCTLDDTCL